MMIIDLYCFKLIKISKLFISIPIDFWCYYCFKRCSFSHFSIKKLVFTLIFVISLSSGSMLWWPCWSFWLWIRLCFRISSLLQPVFSISWGVLWMVQFWKKKQKSNISLFFYKNEFSLLFYINIFLNFLNLFHFWEFSLFTEFFTRNLSIFLYFSWISEIWKIHR